MGKSAVSPDQFSSFGDLLKYLRRREEITQRELAIQVGYSDTQISRLEQNHRVPDVATLTALFVPALHIEREAEWVSRLLALAKEARLGDVPEPETAEISKPKNNLPALLTTFIGRKKEQAEIVRLLGAHRLVTLTGTGGIGKTRTSLQVGRDVLDEYPNGVWFISLAALGDPALLPQMVASVFGLVTQAAIPYTQLLVNFLHTKTALLILDNCEHLLDASASLADTLLINCPNLKILATSREALGILGEALYRLPSLGLPDVHETLEQFRDYESVRLFEERAQLAEPDFVLTMENASFVAQICSRLDGIPLAIELAAARVNVFSTAQIAERLDDRFHLLTGGSRTDLPRQQTIRASIDWSWDLISDSERTLMMRLTIFAGGWTLEAAESICSGEGVEQVPDLLTQLVSKSLIIADRQSGRERRFHLHETIRQYADEKQDEVGEAQEIRSRHLNYFLELSGLAEPALRGPQQKEWFDRLSDERGNFRIALEYASKTDLEAGLYLSANLYEFWRNFDLREGLYWTTVLTQNPESQIFSHAHARAKLVKGQILWNLQQFKAARSIVDESLTIFRAQGDRAREFEALLVMGAVLQFLEGMQQKVEFQLQALTLARSIGDVWMQAIALANLGWDQRDPAQGRAYWEEAIVLLRQAGDWRNLALNLSILGFTILLNGELESAQKYLDEAYELNRQINNREMEFVLTGKSRLCLLRGEFKQARAFLQEDIRILDEAGNRMGYLWGRARLANVALREGNLEEARQILIDVLENFQVGRNKSGIAFALDKMVSLNVVTDRPELAARLIGWSDLTRKEVGDPRPRIEQDDTDRDAAAIIAEIGVSTYEAAYQSGQEMTLDEVVAFALADASK